MGYEVDVILVRTEVVRIEVENRFDAAMKADQIAKARPGYVIQEWDIAPTRDEVEIGQV